MAYPTPIVEIAFSDGPLVASPTWTDVTSDVRSMSIDRGRTTDWNNFVGMAEVVLNNRSRKYDPFYTSGPYYGQLTPRRQIRIRATYSGTTYDVFRGFISGWPPSWTDAGGDSTVTLSCFDLMQLLGQTQGPNDWAAKYIIDTWNPRHFYKLNEPIQLGVAGQTLADSGTNPQNMTTYDVVAPGASLYPAGGSSSLGGASKIVVFTLTIVADGGTSSTTPMSQQSGTVMFWYQGTPLIRVESCGFLWFINVTDNADGSSYVNATTQNGSTQWTCNSANVNVDSGPHHLAVSFDNTTKTFKIYIDGIDYSGTTTSSAGGTSPIYEQCAVWDGTVSQIVIKTGTTPQSEIQTLINWSNLSIKQSAYTRMKYLADTAGIPSGLYDLNSSSSTNVLDISGNAPFLGPECQLVANTESAPLFVSKAGKLTFYNATTIFTQTKSTTSQQTYGSGGLPIGEDIQLYYDGDQIRNIVNVQMSQGGYQTYTNSTSVSTYGSASADNQTQAATIADANVSGNMIKTLGSTPYAKTTPIEVVLAPDQNWATTLGLELNERITVAIAPPTGNTVTLPMLVEHIQHQVEPGRWRTFLEGSNRWAQSYTP